MDSKYLKSLLQIMENSHAQKRQHGTTAVCELFSTAQVEAACNGVDCLNCPFYTPKNGVVMLERLHKEALASELITKE